jgi:hypothetical protein
MLRIRSRALAVSGLLLALLLVTAVPCAHARPAGAAAVESREAGRGWIEAAAAWLSRLLTGKDFMRGQQAADNAAPLTGSCIDPQGIKPCSH